MCMEYNTVERQQKQTYKLDELFNISDISHDDILSGSNAKNSIFPEITQFAPWRHDDPERETVSYYDTFVESDAGDVLNEMVNE